MRTLKLVLSVLVIASQWSCSSSPLLPQTVKHQPATACLTQCTPIPEPVGSSDLDIRRWEYEAIDAFGECRRLHADCVNTLTKE